MNESEVLSLELNKTIQTSMDLVSYLYKKDNVALETNFFSEKINVFGNPGKIQQVVMNLLSNSKHALQDVEEKKIIIRTMVKNGKAIVEVEDNGCGIPSENLDKIFTPFFTTKKNDKGTGLGLDIVRDVLKIQRDENLADERGSVHTIYLDHILILLILLFLCTLCG